MYYKLMGDSAQYASFVPENYTVELGEMFDGRSHAEGWNVMHFVLIDPEDERPLPEIITGYIPLCSRRVYDAIRDICDGVVEFLPCTLGEDKLEYYIFNILGSRDVVDYEQSEFRRFRNGEIMYFQKIVFKEAITEPLFRIPDLPYTYFFCTAHFKQVLESIGTKGVLFSDELFQNQ